MEKKVSLLLFIASIFLSAGFQVKAQTVISGIIKEAGDRPLQLANVVLLKPVNT